VLQGDPPRDRQSEARTALVARARRIGSVEALENVGQCIGGNARAGIAYGQARAVPNAREPEDDAAAWWRVLDRVVDQNEDELPELIGVSHDSCGLELPNLKSLTARQMACFSEDVHQHAVELHRRA
jgi:hypothetical protein